MKLACRWPDYRSPYADWLGLLTTLGDVETLGYQWQGQKDKTHNADRLLKQVILSVLFFDHCGITKTICEQSSAFFVVLVKVVKCRVA